MQEKDPNLGDEKKKPGEPTPGDVGKKGGDEPAIPLGEPTDKPREKPGTEKGPIKQPTV